MARPKKFDEQEAIGKALAVFRTKGYKGTSLVDLTKAMGISRSSLYETFGSKRELFLITLKTFDETVAIYNLVNENANVPAKALLAQVLARVIVSSIEGQGGCMFGSSAIEFSKQDQDVMAAALGGMASLEAMFLTLINAGKINGDVPQDKNSAAIAGQLVATFYGIQTMAKAGVSVDALKQVISQTLSQLD